MDHGNATIPKLKVNSEPITTLELSENNATFTGTATVNKQSGYTFTVYGEDNGEPGWKSQVVGILFHCRCVMWMIITIGWDQRTIREQREWRS
ncbi:MAG: hypothetical protein IBX41_03175 [Methanophagales archaeon]|nr:hypothetical protein [Methanophagales archaeon]